MDKSGLPNRWNISLDSWIIQDGNYPDLIRGQTAEFAVEFWVPDGAVFEVSSEKPGSQFSDDYLCDVIANCIMQTDQVTIFDIGILVYAEASVPVPTIPAAGTFRTKLGIGADPFPYFESLSRIESVPPLVYSWRIESIFQQTAPWIEVAPRTRERDPNQLDYAEIAKTDAWSDDNGYAEYMLRCELLPVPPKRTSSTAR